MPRATVIRRKDSDLVVRAKKNFNRIVQEMFEEFPDFKMDPTPSNFNKLANFCENLAAACLDAAFALKIEEDSSERAV